MPEINYDKTYGALNDAVYVHTLEEIMWCNEKGARLLGYDTPEQLKGKNPFDFATDEHYFDLMMEAGSVGRMGEVFFNDAAAHKTTWLSTDDGQRFIEMLTTLIWQLHGKEGDTEALKEAVLAYFKASQVQINKVIEKTMTDDKFADTMDKYSLYEIKGALTFVSHIQTMLDSRETLDEMKKLLD